MEMKPKYIQIKESILQDIKEKRLKSGDQIPTENELCERFQVSRMTVNKAVSALTSEGYIRRISGKGSFVTNSLVQKQFRLQPVSFSEDMRSIGLVPGAKLVDYRICRALELPQHIQEKLQVKPGDFIHFFSRIRTGNDMNICISYDYVPCSTLPAIDVSYLESSFYEYVRSFGLTDFQTVEFSISATLPTTEQKKLLEIENEALLKASHLTMCNQDKILEYIDTYYIGTMYTYRFN